MFSLSRLLRYHTQGSFVSSSPISQVRFGPLSRLASVEDSQDVCGHRMQIGLLVKLSPSFSMARRSVLRRPAINPAAAAAAVTLRAPAALGIAVLRFSAKPGSA